MDIGTLTGQIEIEDQLSSGLNTAINTVKSFTSSFDDMTKEILTGSALAVGAIAGITTAIIALGNRGSDINDVANTLEHFSGSAENANATMAAMRRGVLDTVDDFELASNAARLLSANVKLSAEDFGTLTSAAFVLQNRGLGTTKQMMDLLSDAMVTGRTRGLALKGIIVDTKAAEIEFARSIGTTRDQLSASGLVEARRIAIIKSLRSTVAEAGEQERDFGEQMQFAVVQIRNWGIELARQVAVSPAVLGAVRAIGNAITETFGGAGNTALQTIIKGIDMFADTVTSVVPTVVSVIGTIREVVVRVWNELVAFNDRWQITSNLVAGARFAWDLLKRAFDLVKIAVQAVIHAWEQMPEWLQRITRNALEATLALSAYSVAIQGVATPVRALVGQVDLAINIVGNLTGAIASSLMIWKALPTNVNLSTAALGRYVVALRMSTIGSQAEIIATTSVALAKQTLAAATNVVTFAFATLAARIQMTTAYLVAHSAMVNVVKTAQAVWATVVGLVSTAYTGLITRLGLTATALRLTTIATTVQMAAMEALGFAILGIQAIPLIALLSGLAFALYKVGGAIVDLYKWWRDGKSMWDFFTQKETNDNWLRALFPESWKAKIDEITNALLGVETVANRISRIKGGPFQGDLRQMTTSPDMLAEGSAEMRAAREARQKLENEQKGIFGLTDADTFIKADNYAEQYAGRLRELTKSLRHAGDEMRIFEQVFKTLTDAQLANRDVQAQIIPMIEQVAEAHGGELSPAMKEAYEAAMATRHAIIAEDQALLAGANVTQSYIDWQKELGKSEQEIAIALDVTVKGLQRYQVELKKTADRIQAQASFENQLTEQIARDRKRRQDAETAASNAIGAAHVELEDLIAETTMSSTDFQIRQIERQQVARELAFRETVRGSARETEQIEAFAREQTEISRRRVAALSIDNQALMSNSVTTLRQMAERSRNTYEFMRTHPELYSEAVIREFKRIAEEAERQSDITRSVWSDVWFDLKKIISGFPDLIVDAFTGGGNLVSALKGFGVQLSKAILEPLIKDMTWVISQMTKLGKAGLAVGVGVAAGIGATVDTTASMIGGLAGAVGGVAAATGMLGAGMAGIAGTAAGLAATTAGIGAAAVGVYVLAKNFFTVSKEVKAARAAVAEFEDKLHDTLTETQKIEAGNEEWKMTVIAVRDAYLLTGRSIEEAEDAVKRLWDTGHPAIAGAAADEIALNMQLALNIRGVRQLVQEYLGAGRTIPASLQAGLDKLVMMKKLTAENATELLNLTKESVPAYRDVVSAAEKYGIQLDSLGPKIQGLRIAEIGSEMAEAWDLFAKAGADMGAVMNGMRDEAQGLVTDALKLQQELPASMEGMIQAMVDARLLTDEFGETLTDTSRLTFAETLEEKIQRIVDAMLRLAEVIEDNVGGALDSLGNRTVSPTIAPRVEQPTGYQSTDYETPEFEQPEYYAHAPSSRIIAFKPRGSDTIPAMLSPGERVLSPLENEAFMEQQRAAQEEQQRAPGEVVPFEQTVNINLDLSGAIVRNEEDAQEIGITLANELRRDPRVRELLGAQLVNIVNARRSA